MPTGYTSFIEDGRITTGKDFLKLCTRAFGIAISLKDEPLSVPTPTNFEPDPYYKEEYESAVVKLEKAKKMTFEEAKILMKAEHDKKVKHYTELVEKLEIINGKYEKVRREVEAWEPPSEDYISLKKFALNQIDMCITEKRMTDKYIELSKREFCANNEDVRQYIFDSISDLQKEAEYYYKKWQEELERVKRNNEWMQTFLNSLKDEKEI